MDGIRRQAWTSSMRLVSGPEGAAEANSVWSRAQLRERS
jgi:hypothetical protein